MLTLRARLDVHTGKLSDAAKSYRSLVELSPELEQDQLKIAALHIFPVNLIVIRCCKAHRQKGQRYFERSIQTARHLGVRIELAKALPDLAAGRDKNRGESWLLGDQYDEAAVAPEFDLEAWKREHGSISPHMDADRKLVCIAQQQSTLLSCRLFVLPSLTALMIKRSCRKK